MVEVYTDKELKLDSLLCYKPMHSAFKDFMQAEKSTGKFKNWKYFII